MYFFQTHARKRPFVDGHKCCKETRTIRSQSLDEHNYAGMYLINIYFFKFTKYWDVAIRRKNK